MAKLHVTVSILCIALITSLAGCTSYCDEGLPASTIVGAGQASLFAEIVKKAGPRTQGEAIGCVRVFVVNSNNYADTLFDDRVIVQDHTIHLQGFSASPVDVIIDREGFFPIKYVNVDFHEGVNRLDQRVLLYPTDIPFVIPGELGVTLNGESSVNDIKPLYNGIDGVSIQRAPNSYELKIPFRGTRVTRESVERLCRKLVYSRHIADARPLVNLSTVVPGL